jgi:hypothetical protein
VPGSRPYHEPMWLMKVLLDTTLKPYQVERGSKNQHHEHRSSIIFLHSSECSGYHYWVCNIPRPSQDNPHRDNTLSANLPNIDGGRSWILLAYTSIRKGRIIGGHYLAFLWAVASRCRPLWLEVLKKEGQPDPGANENKHGTRYMHFEVAGCSSSRSLMEQQEYFGSLKNCTHNGCLDFKRRKH